MTKEQIVKDITKSVRGLNKTLSSIYDSSLTEIRLKLIKLGESLPDKITIAEISKYNRLNNLYKSITDELKKITPKIAKKILDLNVSNYKETYFKSWYLLEKQLKMPITFGRVNPDRIRAVLTNPIPGKSLKDLVVTVHSRNIDKLKFEIAKNLTEGTGINKLSKVIKENFDLQKYEADRIARTETLRASSKADIEFIQKMEDMGIEVKKIWISVLDDRTRPDHVYMDGQESDEDGFFTFPEGDKTLFPRLSGIAGQDINCRCHVETPPTNIGKTLEEKRLNYTKDNPYYMTVTNKNGTTERVKFSKVNYETWKQAKKL